MAITPTLGGEAGGSAVLKAKLGYIENSRPVWAMWDTISNNTPKNIGFKEVEFFPHFRSLLVQKQ